MANRSPQNQFSRDCLFEALMALWDQKHLSEITVTELAQKTGTSRMAFYRHFETKEQLIESYLDDLFRRYLTDIWKVRDLSVGNFSRMFFCYLKENDRLIRHICEDSLSDMLLNKFDEYINVVLACRLHLYDPERLDDACLRHFIAGGLFKCLVEWTRDGMEEPAEQVAGRVAGYIERIAAGPAGFQTTGASV